MLRPSQPLDVPLFWQQSRIVSPVLSQVTRAVVHEARRVLAKVCSCIRTGRFNPSHWHVVVEKCPV